MEDSGTQGPVLHGRAERVIHTPVKMSLLPHPPHPGSIRDAPEQFHPIAHRLRFGAEVARVSPSAGRAA